MSEYRETLHDLLERQYPLLLQSRSGLRQVLGGLRDGIHVPEPSRSKLIAAIAKQLETDSAAVEADLPAIVRRILRDRYFVSRLVDMLTPKQVKAETDARN